MKWQISNYYQFERLRVKIFKVLSSHCVEYLLELTNVETFDLISVTIQATHAL